MRGDNINGAPSGVVCERSCCAVRPCMPGDNRRDSAADWARRRHSSSHAKICESNEKLEDPKWWTYCRYIYLCIIQLRPVICESCAHIQIHRSVHSVCRSNAMAIRKSQLTFDCAKFNGYKNYFARMQMELPLAYLL